MQFIDYFKFNYNYHKSDALNLNINHSMMVLKNIITIIW